MNLSNIKRIKFRLNNALFYFLIIVSAGLIAQLSVKYNTSYDWTNNDRHSLSSSSVSLLSQLKIPITISVFISPNNPLMSELEKLLSTYQAHSSLLTVDYINPDFEPEKVRQYNIQQQAEMVIKADDREQHVYDLSEQSLTNALISVSRQQERTLFFVEGHGERTPFNQANFNLSTFGGQLKMKGFKLQAINLISAQHIPLKSSVVVIASPERAWLQTEIDVLTSYINGGGNILWLSDPGNDSNLHQLALKLGLTISNSIIIDPNAETLGIQDPEFALVTEYAPHPISAATKSVTLFPQASPISKTSENNTWQYIPLLNSQSNTWLKSNIESRSAESNTQGPFQLGYLLTRSIKPNQSPQRIAVIGDGDFLSNSFIGNGANLQLGMAIMNWLAIDDQLISIPIKTTLDSQLDLSRNQSLIIGLGFLIVLPVILLLTGLVIWLIRRKQ